MGRKDFSHRHNWGLLSGDQFIHNIVTGNVIDLVSIPVQDKLPRPMVCSKADQLTLDVAMQEFIAFEIVEKCAIAHQMPLHFFSTRSHFHSSIGKQAQTSSYGIIRESFEDQGLSPEVAEFLLGSWRTSTKQ